MVRSPKDSRSKSSAQSGPNGGPSVTDSDAAIPTDDLQSGAGYGQPPKHHQWKKGQSGNRAGRKKGSKNKRTIIIKLMEQKLGRKIEDISKLSRVEGMLLKGIQKALSGDIKALTYVLKRYDDAEAVQSRAEPISTEQDEAVYAALVDKIKRELSETEQ